MLLIKIDLHRDPDISENIGQFSRVLLEQVVVRILAASVEQLQDVDVVELLEHGGVQYILGRQVAQLVKVLGPVQRQLPSPRDAGGECVLDGENVPAHFLDPVVVDPPYGGGRAPPPGRATAAAGSRNSGRAPTG